jgi:hypothetical protein
MEMSFFCFNEPMKYSLAHSTSFEILSAPAVKDFYVSRFTFGFGSVDKKMQTKKYET